MGKIPKSVSLRIYEDGKVDVSPLNCLNELEKKAFSLGSSKVVIDDCGKSHRYNKVIDNAKIYQAGLSRLLIYHKERWWQLFIQ